MTTEVIDVNMLEELAPANVQPGTAFKITDSDRGQVEPLKLNEAALSPFSIPEDKVPYPRDHRGRLTVDENALLHEASTGTMSTANFPELLRQGVRFDSFLSFRGTPVTWPMFCQQMNSTKQKEQWLKDAGLGVPPVVHEGEDYPQAAVDVDSDVEIPNYKYGYRLRVTEEMRRFDQVGKVRQLSQQVGRSFRMGEEFEVYKQLTTAGNYTRNSTTNDNDVGANTAATTFSALGLIAAFATLTTMKDRKSGTYLGVVPNTLICSPRTWYYVQQLIKSPQSMRAHADDDSTVITVEKFGTGTTNAFFNIVDTIIVSPWVGASYQWCLMERQRAMMFQRVAPFEILGPDLQNKDDTWHFRARNWYGVGMLDDRFAYYSSSTTAPTVD